MRVATERDALLPVEDKAEEEEEEEAEEVCVCVCVWRSWRRRYVCVEEEEEVCVCVEEEEVVCAHNHHRSIRPSIPSYLN